MPDAPGVTPPLPNTEYAVGGGTAYCGPTTLVLDPSGDVDGSLAALIAGSGRASDVVSEFEVMLAATCHWLEGAIVTIGAGIVHVGLRGPIAARIDGRIVPGRDEWIVEDVAAASRHTSIELLPVDDRAAGGCTDRARGDCARSDVVWTHRCSTGVVPADAVRRTVTWADDADVFDALFGATQARTVEDAAVRPVPELRAVGVLVFSTGDRVVADRSMVIGRNPSTGGPHGPPGTPRLVRVEGAAVSRRHAAVTVDRWRASIVDLGSSNGTQVATPGRAAVTLRPGIPVDLLAGARVELGGVVSFTVEEVG